MFRLREQIGPLITDTPSKALKWTPEMIRRLREAHAKYGHDEDVARALSITPRAAERARLRYIGHRCHAQSIAPAPSALQRKATWERPGQPMFLDGTSPAPGEGDDLAVGSAARRDAS